MRRLQRLFSDDAADVRGRVIGIYALLGAFNVGAWVWAFTAFHAYPLLLGTALLFLKAQEWRAERGDRRQAAESSVLVSQVPRVSRGGAIPPSARATKRSETDARATAEIDRVLDKINASGVESLTPAERKFLTEISRRMRTPPKA